MEPFSILWETLSKIYGSELLTLILISGYWMFFLLFYGSPNWGKDKLDWPERLLFSLPLGIFLLFISAFPTLFIFTLFIGIKIELQFNVILLTCIAVLLLILSLHRYYIDDYISSNESINKLNRLPINKIIVFCYLSTIPIFVFSLTVGSTNSYLSNESKLIWHSGFPFLYFLSIFFIHFYYYITLIIIPLVVNRKIVEPSLQASSLSIFIQVNIYEIFKRKDIMSIIKKGKYFILIISIILLITLTDPVFHIFTPELSLIEEKRNPDYSDVVIKPRYGNESYLVPLTKKYFFSLPKIPLLMLSIKNPSNFSDSIGEKIGYSTASVQNSNNIELILNNQNGDDDVIINPIWTKEKIGFIKIHYYNKLMSQKIISHINTTVLEEDKEYIYYYTINKTHDDILIIDSYYLIPPDNFHLYKINSYIDKRNVTNEIIILDGWVYIKSMNIYNIGEHTLIINMKRREN